MSWQKRLKKVKVKINYDNTGTSILTSINDGIQISASTFTMPPLLEVVPAYRYNKSA